MRHLPTDAWDGLGLRRAVPGGLLQLAAGGMVFLAALAGAAGLGAVRLADHWRGGAEATTVQVPDPEAAAPIGSGSDQAHIDPAHAVAARADRARVGEVHAGQAYAGASDGERRAGQARASGTRADEVAALLPAGTSRLSDKDVFRLLRPWLGEDAAPLPMALPAVFAVPCQPGLDLAARLDRAAPGTLVDDDSAWQQRLAALAASLQACAAAALTATALVAGLMVAIATRAGLAASRDAIGIVHGLGAADDAIAGRFAARLAWLTGSGGLLGVVAALPVLLGLARLAAPFGLAAPFQPDAPHDLMKQGALPPAAAGLPAALWVGLAMLPVLAAAIGWVSAQASVRAWLARLP